MLLEPSKTAFQEGYGVLLAFGGPQLCVGQAGAVIDGDVEVFPAEPLAEGAPVALTGAVAGEAVPDPVDAAEFLDVDMDQFAWLFALVADDGRPGQRADR